MPWSELITNSLWCIFWMHVNQNYDWGFFSALDNPFFTCEFLEFRSLVDQWYLSRQKTKASFFKRQKKIFIFHKFENCFTAHIVRKWKWMSKFQFHFPGLIGTSLMLKQETNKKNDNWSLVIRYNPIYLFEEADGQDQDVCFFSFEMFVFYNYPILL